MKKENTYEDLKDLSVKESQIYHYWEIFAKTRNPFTVIRSNFNLDHWRKVKEARLKTN